VTPIYKLILLTASFCFMGCAMAQKDYGYMEQKSYQSKPKLTQSLLGPNDALSEAAIQKILTSKVVLPKAINLAIVRLSDSDGELEFQTVDQEVANQFYNKANWGGRVQSIIPVPQVMLAKPMTLTSLRQAAVLLQADAIVIIKPMSYGDWQFQWLDQTKGKGITTLEVLLLDTRTSVVPYTSLITESVEITKNENDNGTYELVMRAKKSSEAKALLQVAPAIQKFISKAM